MAREPTAPRTESSDPLALSPHELLAARLETLQVVARELIAASTVDDVVRVVLDLVDTPIPAVSRGLWLAEPRGTSLRLVGQQGFPAATAARFAVIPMDGPLPGAVAYRTQTSIISGSRRDSEREYRQLQGVERSAESFAAIPLVLDRSCLGVVGLGYEMEPEGDEIAFLEAVAGQVAQALERVRLADRDRRRREAVEFLAKLTHQALNATDHVDLMRRVTSTAVPMLGDWCSLTFLPTNGDPPVIEVAHIDPDRVAWARELQDRYPYDPDSDSMVARAIRTGETAYIPDVTAELIDEAIEQSGVDPDEAHAILDFLGLTSVIIVPLRTRRRTVGAMQFVTAESGRRYDHDDVDLAEAVAGRLAEPLDNAWYADQQQQMSEALQRSLLPPRLPEIPGLDVVVGYWPAGVMAVGGDFYDVFSLDDGTWSISIGDVCGSGPDAAALTSIVRHTVRAAARHGQTHAAVLDWVNEAVRKSDRDLFCTVCFATVHTSDDRHLLMTANAGHPLPLLLRDGSAQTIGRPGTLVGVFESIDVTTTTTDLRSGDIVVFYTDGITDLPPPFGLTAEELCTAVAPLGTLTSAADVRDHLLALVGDRVPAHHRNDDIAVAVLRVR